jgi:hypothetical protein
MRVPVLLATNLAAPLAWLVFLQAEYALVPWTCHHGSRHHPALFVVAAVTLLVAAAGGVLGWREWRLAGRRRGDEPPPHGRAAFLALTGIGISVIFTLLILASSAPLVVLATCD